jgi:hypothetical protein
LISLKDKAPKESFSISWEELIRNPSQDCPKEGSIAWTYWKNCSTIHNSFLKKILSNSLKSYSSFVTCFEELHSHLFPAQVKAQKVRSSVCSNAYPREAEFTYLAAKTLYDPFFSQRLKKHSPFLPHISKEDLPVNIKHKHAYPFPKSFPVYLAEAHKQSLIIQDPSKSIEEKLLSISLFYQYLINSRMFYEKNNSYLMVLANTFLHYLGLKGISHYILDHLAHRLHYRNFSVVFIGAIILENPSLSRWGSLEDEKKSELCTIFNHHVLKVLSKNQCNHKELIQTLYNDMAENSKLTAKNRKVVELHFSSLERLSFSQKDRFPFAPWFVLTEYKTTEAFSTHLNDLVIFCSEWYYFSYPLNHIFIRNFPKELSRNNPLY